MVYIATSLALLSLVLETKKKKKSARQSTGVILTVFAFSKVNRTSHSTPAPSENILASHSDRAKATF